MTIMSIVIEYFLLPWSPSRNGITHLRKAPVHLFDRALFYIQNIVDADTISPGLEPTATVELTQPDNAPDHDLLSCILDIFALPQHAQSQTE